jgi:hypothetical protein
MIFTLSSYFLHESLLRLKHEMRNIREFAADKTISLAALLLLPMVSVAYAENKNVTPYGDYCKEYSVYGICRRVISPDEAVSALRNYYGEKGCRVLIVLQRGRFIVAEIYRRHQQVDKIIFDRKTGRLRSIN